MRPHADVQAPLVVSDIITPSPALVELDDATDAAPVAVSPGAPSAADLLQSWLGLSTLQRRTLDALIGELGIASDHYGEQRRRPDRPFREYCRDDARSGRNRPRSRGLDQAIEIDGRSVLLSDVASGLGETLGA